MPFASAADKESNDKNPAVAEAADETAAGEAADETAAGEAAEEAAAGETADETAAGETADEAAAYETADEAAAGETADEAAAGETADEVAAGETADETAAGETADEAATDEAAAGETAEEAAAGETAEGESTEEAAEGETTPTDENAKGKELSILDLLKSGGVLMIPIAFMSVLVVMVGLERFFGLWSCFVLPRSLMHHVDVQVSAKADPRAIYALCRRNHSALSNVIQAALFKAGRPMPEVQQAIEQAKENEANRLYSRVRWLVLAASVTPLIGLLGTVVGMIQAFMATASTVGIHKAEMLSEGIYLALITTCAGLAVAIPAAILAHWYEGKIQRLFYRMDQKLINFVSYLEELEGRVHLAPSAYKAYVKQRIRKP
ncbi:MAG: MotA/TolQ/ExbB proton channel family protein [Thermoguttaceae bacterium]|nr:MotA/TolQ/ExbB proton channel family protein [Thermoguttaceae bacterium]